MLLLLAAVVFLECPVPSLSPCRADTKVLRGGCIVMIIKVEVVHRTYGRTDLEGVFRRIEQLSDYKIPHSYREKRQFWVLIVI